MKHVAGYLDIAVQDGAQVALDGRQTYEGNGFLLGPSVVDHVQPTMRVAREEIFGPVLSVVRVPDLDSALAVGAQCEFGNGASIFTQNGHAARQFKQHFNAGMIGINVGVPAPMAWFPLTYGGHLTKSPTFTDDLQIFVTNEIGTTEPWIRQPANNHVFVAKSINPRLNRNSQFLRARVCPSYQVTDFH